MTTNTIFLISIVSVSILGYILGFGRSLKLSTKGIVGIAISIFFCVALGGIISNWGPISSSINSIDGYFSGLWNFLRFIRIGNVVYYVSLFILLQVARLLIVYTIAGITKSDSTIIKFSNKTLGAIYISLFCFSLMLLFFAVLRLFDNSEFTANILNKINGSMLDVFYRHNPIVLR